MPEIKITTETGEDRCGTYIKFIATQEDNEITFKVAGFPQNTADFLLESGHLETLKDEFRKAVEPLFGGKGDE